MNFKLKAGITGFYGKTYLILNDESSFFDECWSFASKLDYFWTKLVKSLNNIWFTEKSVCRAWVSRQNKQ